MKISKNSLLAGLLFAASQSYCMDPATQVYPVEQLPAEMKHKIYDIVVMTENAKTIEEAARMINSLALTNKEFNDRVNDPEKLFYIIKHLAKKFNVSMYEVAIVLGGQNFFKQSRFDLTIKMYSLGEKIRTSSPEELSAYLKQPEISKNFDPNYLDGPYALLPLHWAVIAENFNGAYDYKEEKVRMLLNAGADPNLIGAAGRFSTNAITPLELAEKMAETNPKNKEFPKVIKLLKQYTK